MFFYDCYFEPLKTVFVVIVIAVGIIVLVLVVILELKCGHGEYVSFSGTIGVTPFAPISLA